MKKSCACTTQDRAPPGTARTAYHTVGVIGPKRKLRPDGTLLCEDVVIARTGVHLYAPGEVPLLPSRDPAKPVLYVTRDADTLFAPSSLGSVVGAAVTDNHPPSDVTPENWNQLSRGFVVDAWQGTGDDAGLMFADFVVAEKTLIAKVRSGEIREVSLGYTADYQQTGDGEGRQHNIVINHLALVDRGRCGPRCAIGDRQPQEENMPRSTNGNGGARPRVRLTEAAQNLRSAIDELETGGLEDDDGVHVHLHMGDQPQGGRTTDRRGAGPGDGDEEDDPDNITLDAAIEQRFSSIEGGMLELKGMLEAVLSQRDPGGAGGDPGASGGTPAATGDSAALQTAFTQFVAHAEILIPGFKPPTFDAALPRAKTVDAMCTGRRHVLTLLGTTKEGQALINQVAADDGFNVTTADCNAVATIFKSAAAVRAAANNRSMTGDRMSVPAAGKGMTMFAPEGPKPPTGEEINAANAKFWAAQMPAA